MFHQDCFNFSENKYEEAQGEDEYEDYGEEYGDEDDEEEDDDGDERMFEKPAALYVQDEDNEKWTHLITSNVKVIYDSDIFGARIVVDSEVGEMISETVICMDTLMEVCIFY